MVGAYELAHCLEVPYKVAINVEAVELAKALAAPMGISMSTVCWINLAPGFATRRVKAARPPAVKRGAQLGVPCPCLFSQHSHLLSEPHEVDVVGRPVAPDDSDTLEQTRPLPLEAEVADARPRTPGSHAQRGHIGRYALKFVIGEGGLGTVYAAHDPLLSRLIAIKTPACGPAWQDRAQFNAMFLNEAGAAAFDHPNIVTVATPGPASRAPTSPWR